MSAAFRGFSITPHVFGPGWVTSMGNNYFETLNFVTISKIKVCFCLYKQATYVGQDYTQGLKDEP